MKRIIKRLKKIDGMDLFNIIMFAFVIWLLQFAININFNLN